MTLAELEEQIPGISPYDYQETYNKIGFRNFIFSLNYTISVKDTLTRGCHLFNMVYFPYTQSNAKTLFRSTLKGLKSSMDKSEARVVEKGHAFEYGEESYYSQYVYNEIPVGHVFLCRLKNAVYIISIGGIYFTEAEFRDLIAPKLVALEARGKKKKDRDDNGGA